MTTTDKVGAELVCPRLTVRRPPPATERADAQREVEGARQTADSARLELFQSVPGGLSERTQTLALFYPAFRELTRGVFVIVRCKSGISVSV